MPELTFARPRSERQSYQDFYRIVQLSGFPLVYLDEVDWRRPGTVIFSPKMEDELHIPPNKAKRVIWWHLERCRTDLPEDDMSHPHVPPGVDEVWASDPHLAAKLGARYVFLGGVEHFTTLRVLPKDFDLITLMYWSGRRQALRHELQHFKVADWDHGCWGDERTLLMARSKLLLSAHQDDQPYSEPIKFALAAMHALPLLSEECADSGLWRAGVHYLSAPFQRLSTYAAMLIRDDHEVARRTLAANAWRLVCRERTFRRCVEEAVAERVTA